MKKSILTFYLIITVLNVEAQDLQTYFNKADNFFKEYVSDGKVNYESIKKNPSGLETALKNAENITVSKDEVNNYQAFWINAYNLLVIKGLIDKYPTNSPLDHSGFFDKTRYNVGNENLTLNQIEHELLRGNFKEPRFHFVLVCGALGCPPLISQAYLPKTLDQQMETQTKRAINGNFIKVDEKKKRVQVSQIMEWYKEDFITKDSGEIDFINKYRKEKLVGKYKLGYFPYNWIINKQ